MTSGRFGRRRFDFDTDLGPHRARSERAADVLLSRLSHIGVPVDNQPVRFATITAKDA